MTPLLPPLGKRVRGRKRHLAVDMLGHPLAVTVTPADAPDVDGAYALLPAAKAAATPISSSADSGGISARSPASGGASTYRRRGRAPPLRSGGGIEGPGPAVDRARGDADSDGESNDPCSFHRAFSLGVSL